MPSRTDHVLWELGRQEKIEPSYSKERFKFPPFWLKFTEPEIDSSTFKYCLRGGLKVLSPDFVIFHPAQRGMVTAISGAMNALSKASTPEEYGRVKSVQSLSRPSMGIDNLAIPCLAFVGRGSEEEVAASSRLLVEASADVFAEAGLALPMDALPLALMPERERPSRLPPPATLRVPILATPLAP
ncbi:MAG TPA: hypothetical protein VFC50_00850 [Candidatus Dormibacteraeota bacterium]|nr:hypothetical protein [Candidatus Dormibacteraeota bacterium]